ncbi:MAG: DUF3891 family protein [bacterium]
MLKTQRQEKMWFVTQPDHAQVSGYLAAHWGNDDFARPGYFADSTDPERLRAETVFGIAEHDNGWWEWDATPALADVDGFPAGLADVLKNQQEGMNRWRLGVRRFSTDHPCASLLISFHAYWLYAAKIQADPDPAFAHPLFWKSAPDELIFGNLDEARAFVAEIEGLQDKWIKELRTDPARATWVHQEHLFPHVRLLQLLDGLSLSLCSALISPRTGEARGLGDDEFELLEVPRRNWKDRVAIALKPLGDRRIACDPYPFDEDPLPIVVRARIFDLPADHSTQFQTWWHSQPPELIRFEYCSA